MFTIREVNLTDTDNFMYSSSMLDIAKEKGWWKEGTPFDFTAIYSAGEYLHKYYSGRRMWRAFDLLAPSLKLDPTYDNLLTKPAYPFSVAPDNLISWHDLTTILRDYYAGTEFDLSEGNLAGGAFGNAARFDPAVHKKINGSFERSIMQFRTSYSYVIHIRPEMPLPVGAMTWFGPHCSLGTAYMPFYSGSPHNHAYEGPTPTKMDRTTAMWAFRVGLNYAYGRFNKMIKELKKYQNEFETEAMGLVEQWDKQFLQDQNVSALYKKSLDFLDTVPERWWDYNFRLFYTWSDGYENREGTYGIVDDDIYPVWFLQQVGYETGPGYGRD